MKNRFHYARAQSAISLLFLALVLVGVVAALVSSFQANAVPHRSRPAVTEQAPRAQETAPHAGEQR